jgi:carboxyl-terminal processing protease
MQDKEVPYESASRRMLKAMKEAADEDNFKELEQQIALMDANLKDDKQSLLETYREEIIETINSDIILRLAYSEGVTRHNLHSDTEVKRAVEVLKNR